MNTVRKLPIILALANVVADGSHVALAQNFGRLYDVPKGIPRDFASVLRVTQNNRFEQVDHRCLFLMEVNLSLSVSESRIYLLEEKIVRSESSYQRIQWREFETATNKTTV